MELEFVVCYVAINFFVAMLAIIMLSKLNYDVGSELEMRYFKFLIYALVGFCVGEGIWSIGNFGHVEAVNRFNSPLSIWNMCMVAVITYAWFNYAETKMGNDLSKRPVLRALASIPFWTVIILYVTNPLTNLMFYIDANGSFIHGPLYEIAVPLEDCYLLFVTIRALVKAVRTDSRSLRREYLTLFAFVIVPTVSGLTDMFVPGLPIIAPAILTSVFLVFVNLQESQIFNDALTGLNNRRRADRYLEDSIASCSPQDPLCFFIIDANLFKHINDRYGHLEGDRALVTIADALRSTCEATGAFTARWGGDEFVLIAPTHSIESPEAVADLVHDNLAALCQKRSVAYPLTVTVGYTQCSNPGIRSSEVVQQADAMLLDLKKIAHAQAQAETA